LIFWRLDITRLVEGGASWPKKRETLNEALAGFTKPTLLERICFLELCRVRPLLRSGIDRLWLRREKVGPITAVINLFDLKS
jgi:hypothetical protein